MEYRHLGHSGLKVSPLCLGTMMFGTQTDEDAARCIIARAREQGVNFIDTADVYAEGRSEEIVGRAIAQNRSDWIVATKLGNQIGARQGDSGLSRHWIMRAVEGSLTRLGVDCIDIYYFHKEDHTTPLAESVRAMGDLIRQGKVRYFDLSNFRSWRVAEICNLCDRMGIDRPVVSQPYYNATNRMSETEHLPACGYFGLGVVPYSPLARGVLTGKYQPDAAPPEEAARRAHDAERMAAGITAPRPGDQAACRGARHLDRCLRGRLGAEQPPRHLGDRGPAHARAMGGLPQGARLSLHVRG